MFDPDFRQFVMKEQTTRLARTHVPRHVARPIEGPNVALRLCTVHDDAELERIATLDGRRVPLGRLVIAEVDGRMVAAMPVYGGDPLADPFAPTAHVLPLLRLRVAQLVERTPRRRLAFVPRRATS